MAANDPNPTPSPSPSDPPLLFGRTEPVPSDSDDEIREAMEGLGISPFRIDRPTLSIVNLSALAERIERALRGPINANGEDIDDIPETSADRRAIYAAYVDAPSSLGPHDRFVKARTEFVLRLIREALGGH